MDYKKLIEQDKRPIKKIEDIWIESGVPFSQEVIKGYIMGTLEPLYTGTRDVVCFTINIFGKEEGMDFALSCCKTFDCRIAYVADGYEYKDELWVVRKDNPIEFDYIPSRLSEDKEDHIFRGKLLGYPDKVIESYFTN